MKRFAIAIITCAALAAGLFTGCGGQATSTSSSNVQAQSATASTSSTSTVASSSSTAQATSASAGSVLNTADLFTSRDLEQTADTSAAKQLTVTSGQNVSITEEGVYVLSGIAQGATVTVNADSSAKVQLVLDGLTIENTDAAAIYVTSADKVFITTAAGSTNSLSVTGSFATTEDNVDGAIFSKDDIVLNGAGSLTIESSAHGIVGKDDVKVTGGTYTISASGHGIQGKDSVAVKDGTLSIKAGTDGIHAENTDDLSLGYVYIAGGKLDITATSDGIAGLSVVQVDDGNISINAAEGIEATSVQINGGTVKVKATDDGINATSKSTAYSVVLQINGGEVSVDMGSGDTDALDSNGDLIINGGTVDITAQSPFDWDGSGELNGGTVTVNGSQVTQLTNSMMGGAGGGMGARQQGPQGQQGQGQGQQGSQGGMAR